MNVIIFAWLSFYIQLTIVNIDIKSTEKIKMNITIDLPNEIVEFFETSSDLLDWGFESKEKLLKHILLEGIEHRLEHLGASQSLEQHRRFHQIIDEERLSCHPEA
ncbi:MAG: hypothetical protein ACW97X_12485, partial [Candidatus Hodarchaeales archaeon]